MQTRLERFGKGIARAFTQGNLVVILTLVQIDLNFVEFVLKVVELSHEFGIL